MSGKADGQGWARGSSRPEKQGVFLLWCWGQESPCEPLFQQKAVQASDGKRLPAVEEPCLSCLFPPRHAALSSSCVLCQLVYPCSASRGRVGGFFLKAVGFYSGPTSPSGPPLCSSHIVVCHFFSCLCLACFQHLPVCARYHWLPPSLDCQPLSSFALNCCPISFCPSKLPSQQSSARFLCYSQDGEGSK